MKLRSLIVPLPLSLMLVGTMMCFSSCREKSGDGEPEKTPEVVTKGENAPEDSDYVGLVVKEAEALAKKRKLTSRVTFVDGEPRPMTMDYRHDRVNFEIEEGRVVKVSRG